MCPNIELLKNYRVYPRLVHFDYMRDRYFIYVYLDPFKPLTKPKKIKINKETICFGFEPFYIGKGTGAGYRHNQHITAFIKGNEQNRYKSEVFQKILNNMSKAAAKQDITKPWNWKEFAERYIVVIKTFQTPKELLKFEMALVNAIGTLFDRTGPLTNKIKNANSFDHLNDSNIGPLL